MPFAFKVMFGVNILLLQASWIVGRMHSSQNKGLLCWLIGLKNCATNANAQLIYMGHNWWQIKFCPGNCTNVLFLPSLRKKQNVVFIYFLWLFPHPASGLKFCYCGKILALKNCSGGAFIKGTPLCHRVNQKELPGCRFRPKFSV